MNLYDRRRSCAKCGCVETADEWQSAITQEQSYACLTGPREEAISRRCVNCGYSWRERPLDSPPQNADEAERQKLLRGHLDWVWVV